ncbi:MAG TPA: MtrB/PioB family outer membrane beta-barrel protein [Dokdonella sp.]|uniref:MtrB/PioB family outer membrane beta-barrel protein n=1 Tax=Dokdonella sp. TaxID=2291710 RepID=UPI002D7E2492|nr:MtrB/PioB family outer membrane beta-barrel protein [Dokdonella sp.]HET9033898.1 MtrB/PioB family outer membrane beta-barrel protein [Dokdonella sp.]
MSPHRLHTLLRKLPLAAAILLALPAFADSGVGVDTWLGNKLDPNAGAHIAGCDPRGTSLMAPGQRRSPTGNLYNCPSPPPLIKKRGDWDTYGVIQFGLVSTSGDDRNAWWNRYVDWDSGFILGLLEFSAERAADGSYVNVRASRISDDDAYFQAVFGRAGSYKVQAFLRDMPNVLSNNFRSIWNGVGSNTLTVADGLTAGGSTPEQVAAASAAAGDGRLSVRREKQGLAYSVFLTPQWTAYVTASNEQRKGARPYGGPFFFNFPFPGNGGVFETPKPIDDSTMNFNGGVRYAGKVWRMEFGYQGSFYRDQNTRYTFESPYSLYPVVPGAVSAPIYQGQMSTEPDNNYNNIRASFTRKIPMNGEFSVTASAGRMSQNDKLIAPIDCQGVFGIGLGGSLELGPQNPLLFSCDNWNTTDALSQKRGGMRIDTSLVDARISLRPTTDISVHGNVRYNREDYRNVYISYNPLTGDYGYIAENGSQGSVVPGEIGLWNPLTSPSTLTRVRSLPLDMQTTDASVGADWRLDDKNTLGATYSYNLFEPTNRERKRVDTNSIKLTWVNRGLDWLTLRTNFNVIRQNGDRYNYDPYDFTFSSSLPGYVAPPTGVPAHTVDAIRKYDVSSRDQEKLNVMATIMPRDDMTLSASLRLDRNSYDATLGRQDYDTWGATLQWEWQPANGSNLSAYVAADQSQLNLANVQDQAGGAGADPTLGGPTYPLDGVWKMRDKQRDYYGGINFTQRIAKVRLDLNWNTVYSRGTDRYSYASPAALAYPNSVGPGPGNGEFPAMIYRVNSLTLGVTIPLIENVSLKLFNYYERASFSDWHYVGFDSQPVIDHRVYTDGGPQSYDANLVGMLLNVHF